MKSSMIGEILRSHAQLKHHGKHITTTYFLFGCCYATFYNLKNEWIIATFWRIACLQAVHKCKGIMGKSSDCKMWRYNK